MEQSTSFQSDGLKIGCTLFQPKHVPTGGCPGIVMCQGMAGVKEYFRFPQLGRRLAQLGYVALTWDYRGVGESEGEPGRLFPHEHSEDIRNALTFMQTLSSVDPDRLGLIGWSFGAGMIPYVAAIDSRVKCSVAIAGWADGHRWMRNIRRQWEWLELLDRINEDRQNRVITGKSELLKEGEILVGDPGAQLARERILSRIPYMSDYNGTRWSLATAEKLIEFHPIDFVHLISPRPIMYVVAEKDATCPADHVLEMYERTKEPKKIWVIPDIPHYAVYDEPLSSQIFEATVQYLNLNLRQF